MATPIPVSMSAMLWILSLDGAGECVRCFCDSFRVCSATRAVALDLRDREGEELAAVLVTEGGNPRMWRIKRGKEGMQPTRIVPQYSTILGVVSVGCSKEIKNRGVVSRPDANPSDDPRQVWVGKERYAEDDAKSGNGAGAEVG